jgi:uncharacterized repeat protein (TIGR03803 family)
MHERWFSRWHVQLIKEKLFMTRSDRNRGSRLTWLGGMAFFVVLLVTASPAQAQTLQILHSFTEQGDGGFPFAGLTMDRAGNLYGTTDEGGDYGCSDVGCGVVFRLSHAGSDWTLTPLYAFRGGTDGAFPLGGVVFGPEGALYGTTSDGGVGYGTVFRLTPPATACKSVLCPWTETVLYRFSNSSDGGSPEFENLIFDQAGNLYGTTAGGGVHGRGVVFELSPSAGSWTETVLWDVGNGGGYPLSGVIFDSAGNLYGTTSTEQCCEAGIVYELSPSGSGWTETTLSDINLSGNAFGGVTMDEHGNLFGTSGGDTGRGAGGVYELTPYNGRWTFNALYTFSGGGMGPYDTPTLDGAGNVYATSAEAGGYSGGEVFKLTPSSGGWIYTSLVGFSGANGYAPTGGVILDAAGNIYGTTLNGGAGNYGEVWELTP